MSHFCGFCEVLWLESIGPKVTNEKVDITFESHFSFPVVDAHRHRSTFALTNEWAMRLAFAESKAL